MKTLAALIAAVAVMSGAATVGYNPVELITNSGSTAAKYQSAVALHATMVAAALDEPMSWDASQSVLTLGSDTLQMPEGTVVYSGGVANATQVNPANFCVQVPSVADDTRAPVSHFTQASSVQQPGGC